MLTEEQWKEYHKISVELGQEEISFKTYEEYKENYEGIIPNERNNSA